MLVLKKDVDLLERNFACGSEYSNYLSNIRIREKRLSDPKEKGSEPGIVEPWPELIGGSKNLNCRWIFRFAELIVGPEGVRSAAKVLDLHQKRYGSGRTEYDADPYRKRLPVAEEKDLLIHQKVVCGSEFFTFG